MQSWKADGSQNSWITTCIAEWNLRMYIIEYSIQYNFTQTYCNIHRCTRTQTTHTTHTCTCTHTTHMRTLHTHTHYTHTLHTPHTHTLHTHYINTHTHTTHTYTTQLTCLPPIVFFSHIILKFQKKGVPHFSHCPPSPHSAVYKYQKHPPHKRDIL